MDSMWVLLIYQPTRKPISDHIWYADSVLFGIYLIVLFEKFIFNLEQRGEFVCMDFIVSIDIWNSSCFFLLVFQIEADAVGNDEESFTMMKRQLDCWIGE